VPNPGFGETKEQLEKRGENKYQCTQIKSHHAFASPPMSSVIPLMHAAETKFWQWWKSSRPRHVSGSAKEVEIINSGRRVLPMLRTPFAPSVIF